MSVNICKKFISTVILAGLLLISWNCVQGCDENTAKNENEITEISIIEEDCSENCVIESNFQALSSKSEFGFELKPVVFSVSKFNFQPQTRYFDFKLAVNSQKTIVFQPPKTILQLRI